MATRNSSKPIEHEAFRCPAPLPPTRSDDHRGRQEEQAKSLTSAVDVRQAEALLATTQATVPPMETALKESVHSIGVCHSVRIMSF